MPIIKNNGGLDEIRAGRSISESFAHGGFAYGVVEVLRPGDVEIDSTEYAAAKSWIPRDPDPPLPPKDPLVEVLDALKDDPNLSDETKTALSKVRSRR